MKKILIATSFLACASAALAEDEDNIYLFDQGPGSIYVTGGGGVANMLNDDWTLHTKDKSALTLEQPESKTRRVGTVNAALGYEFDTLPVRLELAYRWFGEAEYTWERLYVEAPLETAKGKVESQAGMFNVFLDWRNSTKLTPFIGGGIGYYFNRSKFDRVNTVNNALSTVETTTHNNSGLAWSATAGLMYNIGPNWFLDVRIEYLNLGHVDFYETNPTASVSPGEQELMKTDRFAVLSGLVNLTYKFALDQY